MFCIYERFISYRTIEIDYDAQFNKLYSHNSIIEPLGMPKITERLSVIMDIFSGF
jgi:hypothetical protein